MSKVSKSRASRSEYVSPTQLVLFDSPFDQELNPKNRWVVLANKIPWDKLVTPFVKVSRSVKQKGASSINPRVILGAMFIKHICDISDRETILQIQENMYMQYFIGMASFSNEAPFDPSLFVSFRKKLGHEQVNELFEKIYKDLKFSDELPHNDKAPRSKIIQDASNTSATSTFEEKAIDKGKEEVKMNMTHKGQLIVDATVCPQDVTYPTDVKVLNESREQTEKLIDILYEGLAKEGDKPRTYRVNARKEFLKIAQAKKPPYKTIRKAIRKQLGYVNRNIKVINDLLDKYEEMPLSSKELKYFMVIQTVFGQQNYMYRNKVRSVENRIVSIHQPHVRPIVRGKANANVEFGAKIQVSLIDGFAFIDHLSWEAYNEGQQLMNSVELYHKRTGYLPEKVQADQIYCTRENRRLLKEIGVRLMGKKLGRPSAVKEHLSPGERNPIEGFFGLGKRAYGLDRIKARLASTSSSWIALILMGINLVKLAGTISLWILVNFLSMAQTKTNRNLRNLQYKYLTLLPSHQLTHNQTF